MENALVIIKAEDIPAAEKVAETLPSYRVFVFDPVLVDRVAMSKLGNVELVAWEDCISYYENDRSSRAAAFAAERELDEAVRDLIPDVSIFSWQYLNWYYLFMAIHWYGGMWKAVSERLKDYRVHVFVCNNPSSYYFNSFIPSLLLLQYLKTYDIAFSGYMYGEKPDDTRTVPDLRGSIDAAYDGAILAHMPTCMYDIHYFNQELQASGKPVINMEARHFNMPVFGHKAIGLVDGEEAVGELPVEVRRKLGEFARRMVEALDRVLAPHLHSEEYRQRQATHFANIYTSQLVTYYLLNQHFASVRLAKVLLSDHDGGYHGPVVAFAKRNHLPVLLVPHAKASFDVEFTYDNIVSLTHPAQGVEVMNSEGRKVSAFKLAYPETQSCSTAFPSPVKTIALLLNSFSLNGVYSTNYAAYLEGIRKIMAWCKDNEIELKIRCKPSYSIVNRLVAEVGADVSMLVECINMPMVDFAASCDLCLMYDAPTSGAIEFLSRAIPLLNPTPKPLAKMEVLVPPAQLVPRETIDDTLRRLSNFRTDPTSFYLYKSQQFREYVRLFDHALPLRAFL